LAAGAQAQPEPQLQSAPQPHDIAAAVQSQVGPQSQTGSQWQSAVFV